MVNSGLKGLIYYITLSHSIFCTYCYSQYQILAGRTFRLTIAILWWVWPRVHLKKSINSFRFHVCLLWISSGEPFNIASDSEDTEQSLAVKKQLVIFKLLWFASIRRSRVVMWQSDWPEGDISRHSCECRRHVVIINWPALQMCVSGQQLVNQIYQWHGGILPSPHRDEWGAQSE